MNTTTSRRLVVRRIVATSGAIEAISEAGERPAREMKRYTHADRETPYREDEGANELGFRQGRRVRSAYVFAVGEHDWITSEADRSSTGILTREEY